MFVNAFQPTVVLSIIEAVVKGPLLLFDAVPGKLVPLNSGPQGRADYGPRLSYHKHMHWQQHRRQMMLDPEIINLNTGSFGPLSYPVFQCATELRRHLAAEPMDFILRKTPGLLWEARCRLAEFLGGRPERLVFTANVTTAVNLVASSLQLAAPGEILLTDHEYGPRLLRPSRPSCYIRLQAIFVTPRCREPRLAVLARCRRERYQ